MNKPKPGPGTYNINRDMGLKENKFIQLHEQFLIFQRQAFKDKLNTKIKKKKITRKNDFYSTYSCFNLDNNTFNQMSIFASKSPKSNQTESKIPGPCYYSPKISPSKTIFNINKTKKWMNC